METLAQKTQRIVAELYESLRPALISYISRYLNSHDDAEDLVQETFVRILEARTVLSPDSAKGFIYRVARNLVYDFLRHRYCMDAAHEDIVASSTSVTNCTEERVIASELMRCEKEIVLRLPRQRQLIYIMSRYEEKSVAEISAAMNLSLRTVENHLRMGRRDVRAYVAGHIAITA